MSGATPHAGGVTAATSAQGVAVGQPAAAPAVPAAATELGRAGLVPSLAALQPLGDDAAGYCADGVCSVPHRPEA
ncbi:hypothetical protein [Georgenia sp. AZ-5]|uniref:hypothetical protein n=1 Tax=Georgenia sp. AZ-5 TaxID=3367526 RepID=UPI003754B302